MRKAFTLIELLIVIAILGILVVGILIALDPVEQTRRATDTTVLRSGGDVKNAVDRFYASKLYFPWCDPTSPAGSCTMISNCVADSSNQLDSACGSDVMGELVNTGELKSNPPASMTAVLFLVIGSGGGSFNVTFNPVSRSFDTNPNTKYVDNSCTTTDTTACSTTPNDCFFCL
ncbi:hypothetical protein A3C98_00170 [Candidatus Roizmanbacteria bacterium RIFCSPHIGHO2_02_FULL_37_15]|uniref:Type II secretion system protein GspG C-terminal domain-containing protein n=1 Tax=Candidatus Roizmanbacteria bacterium RIFCSPLOWO2_01_FULL_37_16 TaxID=1802058 RepID=A0A1F7IKT7_9BACT|nr:MAG: hypothetical protein A2859_04645 [Candidatus Roizmanbacteria bacterium RIFCSPHIGHO2_01_FULL_37_16b]OGK22293.1 MAG: hypothetical protein A3C98_00170 [Candidatus Roizmanbacteria bacterium RIFCSPHIGHO2_02_FULL_37_15]OGK31806.1 MAG: hypothetical protein A3F57_00495 [Candidatus Roizmanbacteria bacterium RIFCSPHIGHO2_12_FULL_36_11]OGK43965.1 MAG: hypothetical protein A3B40_04130 [Candidatus Roizmanbacteria bacterium RIFCSPLOWO2_01_FULL_37_16]OGK56456.1 MAG: hypothetical protein A3I50_00455 [C